MPSKWEVDTDDDGNMYFYNALTGESVWELPPEEEEGEDFESNISQPPTSEDNSNDNVTEVQRSTTKPKTVLSAVKIAIEVAETMLDLVEEVDAAFCNRQDHKSKFGAEQTSAKHQKKKKKKFTSPAAEARAKKIEVSDIKRKKRLREKAAAAYVQIALPHPHNSDTSSDGRQVSVSGEPPSGGSALTSVGKLFTLEDTVRWRLEREMARIKQRRVVRKERRAHQQHVLSLKRQQEMRMRFRTALTTHMMSQIKCSTEVLQQSILFLSSPQQRAELEARCKAGMEPEVAERYAREKDEARAAHLRIIEKVFVMIDEGEQGKLHLLQILVSIFALERVRQCAMQARGLSELINSQDLQKFVVDFVSNPPHDSHTFELTIDEFVDFVTIIEEVVDHCASVKMAVKEAEDEIEATLEAAASTPGVSRVRARVGIVSKKKIEHETAVLKATEEQNRLQEQLEQQRAFRSNEIEALLPPKEEWEKNHHHRFIQFSETLPPYCCLCRRKKWEIERRQQEELESTHRSKWTTRYARKTKEEELKLVEDGSASKSVEPIVSVPEVETQLPDQSALRALEAEALELTRCSNESEKTLDGTSEDDLIVLEVVRSLVGLTEHMMRDIPASDTPKSPKRRVHKKPKQTDSGGRSRVNGKGSKDRTPKVSNGNEADVRLQLAMKMFEDEENERKALQAEEVQMVLFLERERRAMERPLLQVQDSAYNAYIRALSHIVDPCSFLNRLVFLRCLSFTSPQQMTLQMVDRAENTRADAECTNRFVLQTLPCRNTCEAEYAFKQLKVLEEKLRSTFVARVASVSKHTYQFFADSGMLVECWPMLFVATEFYPGGTWLHHFCEHYLVALQDATDDNALQAYARMERFLIASFRQVAAGLTAMHSLGLCHLNLKLDNIFVSETEEGDENRMCPDLKIAGFLACKASLVDAQHGTNALQQYIDHCIAPPEVFQEGKLVTTKADVWMLGCALYEALMLWQVQQLEGCRAVRSGQRRERLIVRQRTISDILQDIPISASTTIRSLLRMLLQPNPLQRPQMSQILDMLTFHERQTA